MSTDKQTTRPVLLASGFEVRAEEAGETALFYGVTRRVETVDTAKLPANTFLVFCSDERFRRHVEYHFSDMDHPDTFVGSTMFASMDPTGVEIEVFRTLGAGRTEKAFAGKVAVAYFEAGDKGHTVRPKRTPQ